MASQTCEHCGASVAADEQFCPSCGSFMDPMSSPSRPRPKPSGNVISVNSDGSNGNAYEEFSLDSPPEEPEASEEPTETPPPSTSRSITCPSCGAINPANNRHCQECGARLAQGPLPTAPRPAVQATAGVRAALAISGLLLGVIVIALLFNTFTGGDEPEAVSTTVVASTTVPPPAEVGPIAILGQTCEPDGIGSLLCPNLTDGNPDTEFQTSWAEVIEGDGEIIIRFTFSELMAINEIRWTNIENATRFRQNYRARGIEVSSQDQITSVPFELQDLAGIQTFRYSALNTARLDIRIVSAYNAEVIEENIFDEIAIAEITIIGRPSSETSNTTPSTTTTTAP